MPKYQALQETDSVLSWLVIENKTDGTQTVHLSNMTQIQAKEIVDQLNNDEFGSPPTLTVKVTLKKLNQLRMMHDWQLREEGFDPQSITAAWGKLVK